MTFLIFKNSNKVINNFVITKQNTTNIFKKKQKQSFSVALLFDIKQFAALPYSLFPAVVLHNPALPYTLFCSLKGFQT